MQDLTRQAPSAATASAPERLVLDTNVVLDWLVFGDRAAARIGEAIIACTLRWMATARMLDEWRSVLTRPLADRWEQARQRALTVDLAAHCQVWPDAFVGAESRLRCRDAADQMFIDLALARAPALLLTRDRALLALRCAAVARGVIVATPQQWDDRIASRPE